MDEPVFPDKSHPPTDADVAKVLGRGKRHWDDLKACGLEADPAATPEWKYYMKKTGWTFVLRGKRRNLVYMRPTGKGCFAVSLVFGDKAVKAIGQSDLPGDVIEMVRKSPKYPEGRGIRLEVKTAAAVKVVKRLLAIKVEH